MTERVFVIRPAHPDEVAFARNETPNVAPRERAQLVSQMQAVSNYAPRVTATGRLVKCAHGCGCPNSAIGYARKQLCPVHYVAFLERSNRARAMPGCQHCNQRTLRRFGDEPCCSTCEARITQKLADLEELQRSARAAEDVRARMLYALESAETVHDLKIWIKDYRL
jgi:hypothetical protein